MKPGKRRSPLDNAEELLPTGLLGIVRRETPIPSIAARAAELRKTHPKLVRADIGQISGIEPDLEILYAPPVGLEELRRAIAESWNLSHGLEPGKGGLSAVNVCVTTGAAEALSLLFHCFATDRVVAVSRGHWENYTNGVELAGGRTEVIDFFDSEGRLDLAGLEAKITDLGIEVMVANFPCNPTGAVLSPGEARELAALIEKLGLVCISDEVYGRLRFDGNPPQSLLPLAPGNVVAIGSASKEYLLPGARVGYVLASNRDLTDRILRRLLRANTASPNVPGQKRLLALLESDLAAMREGQPPTLITKVRDEMKLRRDRLVAVLGKHGMKPVGRPGHKPEGTIFLMASVPDWFEGDDAAFCEAMLVAGVVSIVPGAAFGLPGSVRFSFGGMTVDQIETLDRGLAAQH